MKINNPFMLRKTHQNIITQYQNEIAWLMNEMKNRDNATKKTIEKYQSRKWGTLRTFAFFKLISMKAFKRLEYHVKIDPNKVWKKIIENE